MLTFITILRERLPSVKKFLTSRHVLVAAICLLQILMLCSCSSLSCKDSSECRLQSALEKRIRCSPKVRPVVEQNLPLQVTLELLLISINTIQEKQQIFQANVWIEVSWTVCSLIWDSDQYEGTRSVLLSLRNVWRPYLCFMNDITNDKYITLKDDEMVLVESSGQVNW